MKLLSLTLRNFKGRNFTFEPNGNNAHIYGRNATGKTTLWDSYLWLLFGKDSLNRATFDIKPLDENNGERTMTRLDKLAEAGERLITAKTAEIWMSVVIGFGLIMLVIWGFQTVCLALRELARTAGI